MAFTYATAIAAIVTHATAAGAAGTPPITDVANGPPLPVSTRCVRIFYDGENTPEKMGGGGGTQDSWMFGEKVVVILWIAVSNISLQEITAVETELYTFKHELRTRLMGDSQLGGSVTDLTLGLFEADYLPVAGVRYRVLEVELTLDYSEYTRSA